MERLMQSIAVVIILANVSIEWTNGQREFNFLIKQWRMMD